MTQRSGALVDPQAALVQAAKAGDRAAIAELFHAYHNLIRSKAHRYFLAGADLDDLLQEGRIGLYKAICDYREDKQVSFGAFADLCMTRQIITAVKSAARRKHEPLNRYISLDTPAYEQDTEKTPLDMFPSGEECDPEALVIGAENNLLIQSLIGAALSDLEQSVLNQHLQGKTYQDISDSLHITGKSVDNAMQRIKRKLKKELSFLIDAGD